MNRFKILKIFSLIFKVLAFASVAIGLITAVGVFVSGGTPEVPRQMSILFVVGGAFQFVVFYTVGDLIRLLLAIEEQTRRPN